MAPVLWQYKVDLHVHTRRFSPCAETLDPDYLHKAMTARGIHGVVITEHDRLWPAEDIAALNRNLVNQRIYRGVEVSSKNGHFIIIGADTLDGIRPGIGIHDLLKRAQRLEAVVIWAHPLSNYENLVEPLSSEMIPSGLHAMEVAGGMTGGENIAQARAIASLGGWTEVSGSDAHILSQVGTAYTCFERLPRNEKLLAAAIRDGCCRPAEDV